MDWTKIIIASYWPIVILVFLILCKKQIRSFFLKNPALGELLVELNQENKILDSNQESKLSELDTSDVWALNDISKYKGIDILKTNPVQKYAYKKLINAGFVKKEGNKLLLTDNGRKVVTLAEEIKI